MKGERKRQQTKKLTNAEKKALEKGPAEDAPSDISSDESSEVRAITYFLLCITGIAQALYKCVNSSLG